RGRRDRGPPRGGGVPGRWGLGMPPLREGFGRVGLGRSYHDPRTEAHAIDMDVDKACLAPVALDGGLRVRRVEALDASSEECADADPSLRDRAADERQSERRVCA